MVGLMLYQPEAIVCAQAPPAKPSLRHLTAILTASWPEKKISLLHQSKFSHFCVLVFMIHAVFIFAVLYDGDQNINKSINE